MSVGSYLSAAVDCLPYPADNSKEVLICHEKGWSKSVLAYALHILEKVLGLARFRVFVPNMYVCIVDRNIMFASKHYIPVTTIRSEHHPKF